MADLDHPDSSREYNSASNRCAATSTSHGTINFDRDVDEEWLSYEKITEIALRRPRENSSYRPLAPPLRPIAKSADWLRRRTSRGIENKRVVLKNAIPSKDLAGEIIFDERADGDKARDVASLWMRKSLFPYVPPYVRFYGHDRGSPEKLPKDFTRLLKWKVTACMPKLLIRILLNSGYQMVNKGDNWSAVWYPRSGDPSKYQRLKSFQKVNSIPGSQNLANKDLLWTNLSKMMRKFGSEYNFMPKTFVLPKEIRKLQETWLKYGCGKTWIIKPPSSSRGQGIRVIDRWWEIPKWHSVIVQRYVSRPKLVNNTKFDLRVYVLVTSVDPLRIYIYREGLVRFASVRYVRGTNLHDKYMHLTNTSVNKQNPDYVTSDGPNSRKGHKWSFESLWSHLRDEGVEAAEVWSKIKDIVVKTIIAAESSITAAISNNLASRYTCYELYGFDVLLDENFKPWLLEVNALPSLQADSPLDTAIKGPLIRSVLNIAGYQVPKSGLISGIRNKKYDSIALNCELYGTALSLREKAKQSEVGAIRNRAEYRNRILERLTRDDLRQLVRYEDELSQVGNFEKIFPTKESYSYLRFFEMERYYDRLLDAWEHRYSDNRTEGIDTLKKYCEKMHHLRSNSD